APPMRNGMAWLVCVLVFAVGGLATWSLTRGQAPAGPADGLAPPGAAPGRAPAPPPPPAAAPPRPPPPLAPPGPPKPGPPVPPAPGEPGRGGRGGRHRLARPDRLQRPPRGRVAVPHEHGQGALPARLPAVGQRGHGGRRLRAPGRRRPGPGPRRPLHRRQVLR